MTRTAVVICPGRGTYNKEELGYLERHHKDKATLFAQFDALRADQGQEPVTALDGANKFSMARHTRGDVASPLIFSASFADAQSLQDDIDVVAVTGNSMGWYTALAVGGALSPQNGFNVVNTMGRFMQEQLIGGQLIFPFVGDTWENDPNRKSELLELTAQINALSDHDLSLSIDLGGMLVLAGNEAGLAAFEDATPKVQGRFPMRLPNHAAFHSDLQSPVALKGQDALSPAMFAQPTVPLIDGRGHIWWPHSSSLDDLWNYTLGHQITQTYDFTKAILTAARAFAPDLFIISGPGTTLGGAVAQSLILGNWQGMRSKEDFQSRQADAPFLISMGRADQRVLVEK